MERPLSEKQRKIVNFLLEGRGQITKKEAVILIGGSYYCNESKHTGDVLSRMVKRGILARVKTGVYRLGTRQKPAENKYHISPRQMSIF